MEKKFIMTAFGTDRPGIVADVTQLIYEHDCNLEDSTMTRLSDEFTMMFLFSGQGEDLEEQLKEYYGKLLKMKENEEGYLPGIYSLKLKNLHEKSFEYAISSIGEPNIDNLCRYYDQKDKFGLNYFDDEDLTKSLRSLTALSQKVINRNKSQVQINPKQYTIENLAETVLELYRFPLLIVLTEKDCYSELVQFHKAFNGIISNETC